MGTTGKTAVTLEQAIKAVGGSGGVKTTIAKRLNVTRQTIDNYLDRWATFRQAYEDEKSGVDDAAVSVVMNDIINNKNVDTAKWWVARKLDEFSDKSRHEVTGADGRDLIPELTQEQIDERLRAIIAEVPQD